MGSTNGWRVYEHGAPAVFEEFSHPDLGDGELRVRVEYSSINYKDALALTGSGRIARSLPLIPGIDFAGEVTESSVSEFPTGTQVFGTGLGVGEEVNGGLARELVVPASRVLRIPERSSAREVMVLGTAGFTALLCIEALEQQANSREVVVTGSSGGVGSIAVSLLAQRGWEVTAISGSEEHHSKLRDLGASNVLGRDAVSEERKFGSETWSNAVDCVGGDPLAGLLSRMGYGGIVAACGNAAGMSLNTSILPFILRGVRLIGIDSVYVPIESRSNKWDALLEGFSGVEYDESWVTEVRLEDASDRASELISGGSSGRTLVRVAE
ncbi:acrylyl-CoA reductase family protein [Dietzia sp. NPDC055343]